VFWLQNRIPILANYQPFQLNPQPFLILCQKFQTVQRYQQLCFKKPTAGSVKSRKFNPKDLLLVLRLHGLFEKAFVEEERAT
jgi:hypothetical protein